MTELKPKTNIKQRNNENLEDELIPINPNLDLPGEQIQTKKNLNNHSQNSKNENYIKQQMAIQLLRIIQQKPETDQKERTKIDGLIDKVYNSKYYYCHEDLNGSNARVVRQMQDYEYFITEPTLLHLKDSLKYDVEFYKLGKTCGTLRKRYAIIKRGGFFSSKKPIEKIDFKTLKDKTKYLHGSHVHMETYDPKDKNQGEWSNKKKLYRIRINYVDDNNPYKKLWRSFFMYFENEEKMREVEIMLYGLTLNVESKKKINDVLDSACHELVQGNLFYTIMKMLSAKAQRKNHLKYLENLKRQQEEPKIEIEQPPSPSPQIQNEEIIDNVSDNEEDNIISVPVVLKEKPPEPEPEQKPIVYRLSPQFSDFNPVIENYCPLSGVPKVNEKSINDFVQNYQSIEKNLGYSCTDYNPNVKKSCRYLEIDSEPEMRNDNSNDLNMSYTQIKLTKYIYFDKNKPEIQFKKKNNEDLENGNILGPKDIYEISNVILHTNIDLNRNEENKLVIFGPKKDNRIGIEYKYKDISYTFKDPELYCIKNKVYSFHNEEKRDFLILQIYQLEYEINENNMLNIDNNLYSDFFEKNNIKNPLNDLYFGFDIICSNLKHFEGPIIPPKCFCNNLTITQINKEYYIPYDLFQNNHFSFKIRFFAVPKDKMKKINYGTKDFDTFGRAFSYEIGCADIQFDSIKQRKYIFPIYYKGTMVPNSNLILAIFYDRPPQVPFHYLKGKDYAIGSDSYITKTIDMKFIEDVRDNPNLTEENKNKFINISFDKEPKPNFLFRPNENMKENDFIRDIAQEVSEDEIQRIIYNKRFPFLPMCEKFVNGSTLKASPNLQSLSEQKKQVIINTNNFNQKWIYKQPEIKVRITSKNLGIIENGSAFQLLYPTGEKKLLNKDKIYENVRAINNDEDFLIPLNENDFNVLDMNELDRFNNFDNFKWKLCIKFLNEIEMFTFVKLLKKLRQQANTNILNSQNEINPDFDYKKFMSFDEQKANQENNNCNCNLIVDYVEFRKDFRINEDSMMYMKIFKEGNTENFLLDRLINPQYGYKNDLLNNPEVAQVYDLHQRMKGNDNRNVGKRKVFPNYIKLPKDKFNNGSKKLMLKKMEISYPVTGSSGQKYDVELEFRGQNKNNNNKIENDVFFSPIDLWDIIINREKSDVLELPLYKRNDPDQKIYGCLVMNVFTRNNDENLDLPTFYTKYQEYNENNLNNPIRLLQNEENGPDDLSYIFGVYEPNVYRRKILNLIHEIPDINANPAFLINCSNNDKDILYNELFNRCVMLPEKHNFENTFNYKDIRKNFKQELNSNSYRRKIGLKILKMQRHEKFMTLFKEKEWEIYIKNFVKKIDPKADSEKFFDFKKEQLILNSKDVDMLHNLMYYGIPNQELRYKMYVILLEIDTLYFETRDLLNKKFNKNFDSPPEVFDYYVEQLINPNLETNIIFSLIDNDANLLNCNKNTAAEYINEINEIKKVAKAFFLWADLGIRLKNSDKGKYNYFIGLLSIIQKLKKYFKNDCSVFWIVIGLSQNIAHFHQQNPLFTDDMNYINIFGLVTKLILECHHKEIYNKFLSLNFPPEFFFSKHLSTLYTDFFKSDLIMRIFDIIVFESSLKKQSDDDLQYLRVLCAIPVTLLEFSKKNILACESVSEIKSVFDDMISKTLNANKLISALEKNVSKFFYVKSLFEKLIYSNQGREWDSKRGKIQNLIYNHFKPIYEQNINHLKKIYEESSQDKNSNGLLGNFIKYYFDNVDMKLNTIRTLYGQGTPSNFKDPNAINGVQIRISKLQEVSIENINMNEFVIYIAFGDFENEPDTNMSHFEGKIEYDIKYRKINNLQNLIFRENFTDGKIPKYIHFILMNLNYGKICSFVFDLSKFEPMNIEKIVLENKEEKIKYSLEFVIYKYSTNKISSDDITLFNTLFSCPEYIHSTSIEEQFFSQNISSYQFKNEIGKQILIKNEMINRIMPKQIDGYFVERFRKMNNVDLLPDTYNKEATEKIIKLSNSNLFNQKITDKVSRILNNCLKENIASQIMSWLNETNISFEEMLYSLVLIDKSSCSINDKLWLLFSIAQTKDKLIYNNEKVSIKKIKEMIYSLYKRFMIYFTKTDVERMIDFLLKDERLYNVKYVFIYNQNDEKKIIDFMYDLDRYPPCNEKAKRKSFEILYDNIDKEFNSYINYLNNHYNMNELSTEMIELILYKILNDRDLTYYIQNNYDTIKIVISKDDIEYQRNYNVKFSPLVIKEFFDNQIYVKPKDGSDVIDDVLAKKISYLEICNSQNYTNYISFDKFKEIFFNLPYLSDLLRVSFSNISENKNKMDKEFDNFTVVLEFDNKNYIFYFPYKGENEIDNQYYMSKIVYETGSTVKLSHTVDQIIKKVLDCLNGKINYSDMYIMDYLKSPEKIQCFIIDYLDDNKKGGELLKQQIGYFDSLFSSLDLKKKSEGELEIVFNVDVMSFNSNRKPVPKENGYCKVYYPIDNYFYWRKCKMRQNNYEVNLCSTDYKTKYKTNRNSVVTAYNL